VADAVDSEVSLKTPLDLSRRALVFAIFVAGVAGGALWTLHDRSETFTYHYDNVLGTSLDITVRASSERAAVAADAAIRAQIDHDAKILSSYDPSSEFSHWFQTANVPTAVSPELFTVLDQFDKWRDRTDGALDAAVENVSRVWRTAAAAHHVPAEAELAQATRDLHVRHWTLDPVARTATHTSTVPLALNSFTKSYIVERAADAAVAVRSVDAVIVNVGGDLVSRGAWTSTVGIVDPQHDADNDVPLTRIAVVNKAVATSGTYRRGFDIGGRHYSHIIDPRTGQPAGHVLSATVVANQAVTAGALATAFSVLAPSESQALAASYPDAEFLLVLADGRRVASAGWHALEVTPFRPISLPSPIAHLTAAEQTWVPGFELTITVELARTFGNRPYLAVWIDDADKFPVRTLALWFDKGRYLPELRAWYREDRLRALAEGRDIIQTVSSATRNPGRYTFTWDGKDGQGKLVKPGSYTVMIEAAREHGTYQIMRQAMDFSGEPKQATLPPGTEIAGASLDYHKVAAR